MKASLFDGNIFWGSLIIILGLSMILKAYGITFPILRLFFGGLLIYIGVYILSHRDSFSSRYSWGDAKYKYSKISSTKEKYSVAFCKKEIDLSYLRPQEPMIIEVSVFCSNLTIKTHPHVPVETIIDAFCSQVNTPQTSFSTFASHQYANESSHSSPLITLRINAACSNVEIQEV